MSPAGRATLRREARFEGRGIHTGSMARVVLEPVREGGLRFWTGSTEIPVDARYLGEGERGTNLRRDGAEVKTVEHFLAACAGLGLTDLLIRIEGPEVPGLDGSALEYCRILQEAGLEALGGLVEPLRLGSPIQVERGGARIEARPAPEFSIGYHLAYPDYPVIADQSFAFHPGRDSFLRDLAPARTFCLDTEVEALKKAGLAQGGSLDTAVVAGRQGYLNPSVRFPDEPCRHKCLDLLGDLQLLGRPLIAEVRADRSGHRLNGALVRAILEKEGVSA